MHRANFLLLLTLLASLASAQTKSDQPTSDVLIFTNGDQLTGKLERAVSGSIVFKSDMAGELTVGFDKIKEVRSGSGASQFALLRKGAPLKEMTKAPEGTIVYADGSLTVAPPAATPVTVKAADIAYLIDKSTYDKSVAHRANVLDGWAGTITGGATVVRSASNGTTLTAGANLVRAIPVVPYLPARNRTTLNLTESYGTLTTIAPPSSVKTSIFHADGERDEYFNPRLYALADFALDHNFAQLLQLQQVYGIGVGWTPVKDANQELNFKGEVHYGRQQFIAANVIPPTPVSPSVSLFGSIFGESYRHNLPRRIVFTEVGSYLPAWTVLEDYSANLTATLALPVFKRLGASISTTDNYLNNAPAGSQRNSYQFVTGVTYTLH